MSLWLPEGYHNGLHIQHEPLEDAGAHTCGSPKWVWHITVSSPWAVDLMADVLAEKRAAPHLLIGFREGVVRPVVYQFISFDRAGRSLAHPPGTMETNRANAVQCEIAANVADVPHFDEWGLYKALANLVRMTNDVLPKNIPHRCARSFNNTVRLGEQAFVDAAGHCGHMHVPHNDHTDPTTAFQGNTLMTRLRRLGRHDFYSLEGVHPR